MERDKPTPPPGGWNVSHAEMDIYGRGWRYPDGRPVLAERAAVDALDEALSYTRIASSGIRAARAASLLLSDRKPERF